MMPNETLPTCPTCGADVQSTTGLSGTWGEPEEGTAYYSCSTPECELTLNYLEQVNSPL